MIAATGVIHDTLGLSSGPYTITGMSLYAGADNLLYSAGEPYVDFGGISFTTQSAGQAGPDFNIGGGGQIAPYGYVLNDSFNDPGGAPQNDIGRLSITDVPEPATWALMLIGFGGMGLALRSRRGLLPAHG